MPHFWLVLKIWPRLSWTYLFCGILVFSLLTSLFVSWLYYWRNKLRPRASLFVSWGEKKRENTISAKKSFFGSIFFAFLPFSKVYNHVHVLLARKRANHSTFLFGLHFPTWKKLLCKVKVEMSFIKKYRETCNKPCKTIEV